MEYLSVVIIVAILLGIGVFGLSIQILFKKSHKFPDFHVGHNKEMKKRGIYCAQTQDKIAQKEGKKSEKNTKEE